MGAGLVAEPDTDPDTDMRFANFSDFLAMRSQDGLHADGLYVWLAYGVTLVVIMYNVVAPSLRQRRFIRQEQQRLRRAVDLEEDGR